MKKNVLLISLLSLFLLAGCSYNCCHMYQEEVVSKSYVFSYYLVRDIIATQDDNGMIKLCVDGHSTIEYNSYHEGEKLAIFQEMNSRHNDTAYNRPITVYWNGYKDADMCYCEGGHTYPCLDIQSVDVTCTEDFDANHPANTSLNDIVSWVATSAMPYIQSGYIDSVDWSADPLAEANYMQQILRVNNLTKEVCHKVDKRIVDLTLEDWMLNGGSLVDGNGFSCLAYLRFDNEPTIRVSDGSQKSEDDRIKKHIIITINGFDGKKNVTFTTECDMEF